VLVELRRRRVAGRSRAEVSVVANDKMLLVCRGRRCVLGIFKYFGRADPSAYISGDELGAFIAEHLYHTGHHPDRFHLPEDAFEVQTDHMLMSES
jgi:hypothetical protein